MYWKDFIMGGMAVIIAYSFYYNEKEEEVEVDADESESNVEVNDFTGRFVTLSCQGCRKLKRHKEVKPDLFQCTKCKRHVDIRAS